MTDNLPTVINQEELDAFLRETEVQTFNDFLPNLRINYDEKDANGKPLELGTFYLSNQNPSVYTDKVTIRPLLQDFQWTEWDEDDEKTVNRTIFVKDLTDEARDEKGTLRCGKPASKILKEDKKLAKQYANIRVFRTVHVLVSYTGKDAEGREHTIENVPAVMRLKGATFMGFGEEYVDLLPRGSRIWDYSVDITTEKQRKGTVDYWIIHYNADFTTKLPLTVPLFDTMKAMQERIKSMNADIEEKYLKATTGRTNTDAAFDALDITPRRLDDDFNNDDDIPF